MAAIYLLSALLFGVAVVRRIPFPLYRFERVAMVIALGLFLWTWIGFLLALVLPIDAALPIAVVGCAAGTIALWSGGAAPRRELEGGRTAWIVWGAATVITFVILARLFWTHSLPSDAGGVWSGGAAWADYGVHASFISHINAASNLPGDLPVASGEHMTYPFLIDVLSGFFSQGGMSLNESLFWPGLLLSLSICQLLIAVGMRLFQRISVAVGGLAFALLLGSAAGVSAAWSAWRDSGKGLFWFLGHLPSDFTGVGKSNANVTNLLVDAILPQRSILFGLTIGLIALIFLHTAREREETRLIWPAAVLIGLLPMAHPHTFIVGVAWLVALAIEAAWRTRAAPWAYLKPLGVTLVMALPQIAWQQFANSVGTGGRFRFGWMWDHTQQSLPGYYWANFGLIGLGLIAIPFLMRKDKRVFWFLPMLVILFITQIYAFQPFEYDNLKLIYWVYIMGGFFLMYLATELVRRSRFWLALLVPLGLFVASPGALAITHEFQLHDQFASPDDVALANWAKQNTPYNAVFAATDRPNMPVATLAGRSLVMGYRGWLYNFSLPYDKRDAAIRAGLAGKFDDPGLKKFGATYLAVGTNEDQSWAIDRTALAQHVVVYSNPSWQVYQLR